MAYESLAPPATAPDASAAEAPVVDIRGLWTAFGSPPKQVVVHQDLALRIERGEILSLVGGSGTGKTVLLRQMLGLEMPTRGEVEVLGEPASQMGRRGASSRVGMLFQHGALFSAFSVLDNIAFALRELKTLPTALARDVAMVKLQMVGLKAQDGAKMPADLSGGMVKRVALARALAMDPPLLLLDEPTAGLDPSASDDFCELLRSLHQELGLTVVMVTHDLDTLFALSTRVASVRFGVSVHDGNSRSTVKPSGRASWQSSANRSVLREKSESGSCVMTWRAPSSAPASRKRR